MGAHGKFHRRRNVIDKTSALFLHCDIQLNAVPFFLREDKPCRADEIIQAQDKHLKEMVAGGDHTHTTALNEMKRRWRHPISGMGWYRATKREFAARSEDRADQGAAKTEGHAT